VPSLFFFKSSPTATMIEPVLAFFQMQQDFVLAQTAA
jgi:hypothetical protein